MTKGKGKVSSIDVYLNLDDCILHYSPMFFSEFCAYCSFYSV